MTKAKWVHKWPRDICNCTAYCGITTFKHGNQRWSKVTCPKCLAKKRPTKKAWVHKHSDPVNGRTHPCGALTANCSEEWANVTCPKCLATKAETHLDFELTGKVFITERRDDGTIVSQEEIDGKIVLQYLAFLLEQGIKTELSGPEIDKILKYDNELPRFSYEKNNPR